MKIRKQVPVDEDYIERTGFRWRAHDSTRIEEFSDAMFAITIALLMVSVEVPRTYEQLIFELEGFFGFAVTFAFLMWVWYIHYIFFRRYGLRTTTILVLNTVLLFLIMFYSYPLKFIASVLIRFDSVRATISTPEQFQQLMVIYGLGMAAIFLVYFFMFRYAMQRRNELNLLPHEVIMTKSYMVTHVMMMSFGFLSALLAILLPTQYMALSGLVYFLIGPAMGISGWLYGKRASEVLEASKSDS